MAAEGVQIPIQELLDPLATTLGQACWTARNLTEQAGRHTAHAYPAENREPAELVDGVVLGGGATSWSGSRRSASLHSSLHGLPYPPYAGPVLLSPHRA